MNRTSIGLIGLGLLGSAVADRLRAAGWVLCGFDIQPERVPEFARMGAEIRDTAADVFDACGVVLLALPDSNATAAVLNAVDARPGTTILDLTTGDPDRMAGFGQSLAKRGIAYVDAMVGGSSEQVRGHDAIVMAGGEKHEIERVQELLKSFAREVFHVGGWGSGARMKLAMNLVLGLNRAALAEGLAFARATGLELEMALRVFQAGPAWSRAMDVKGQRMIERNFTPAARLSQHRKDVDLILAAAEQAGAQTPLSRVHRDLLVKVERAGFGAEDNSAILRAFELE
jgi:3-hydroxyisobutyrate dehydrogenase-like beta-hydroxyacid dehydrogenase